MFISYLIFFIQVIYFSHSGAPVVYLVLFMVIMCRDGTYRLHMSIFTMHIG